MTVLARKDSRSSMRMPSKSLRCMSYEDTFREMEAFLDDVYVDITEPMSSISIRLPDCADPHNTHDAACTPIKCN